MTGRCSPIHYIKIQEVTWESQIWCTDYQADMLDISEHTYISGGTVCFHVTVGVTIRQLLSLYAVDLVSFSVSSVTAYDVFTYSTFITCNDLTTLPQTFYILGEIMDLKMLSLLKYWMMVGRGEEKADYVFNHGHRVYMQS